MATSATSDGQGQLTTTSENTSNNTDDAAAVGATDVNLAHPTKSVQNDIIKEVEDDKNDDQLDTSDTSCSSSRQQIELEEERKLKAKHPAIQRPGSEFLQKRLQRGQKYFDSGDYNMAKASTNPSGSIKLPDGTLPATAIDSKILNKRH